MSEPRIEIKNVKYAAHASQETHCFQATVYVDGERFAIASNEGHGGCDNLYPVKKDVSRADFMDQVFNVAKRVNPNAVRSFDEVDREEKHEWPYAGDWFKTHSMTATQVFEAVVSDLVTRWLIERDIKKDLRNNFVVVVSATSKIVLYKKSQPAFRGRPTADIEEALKKHVGQDCEVINEWPMDDIIAAYELNEEINS